MTRQRIWQLKQMAEGRCAQCGAPRHPASKTMCLRCAARARKRNRARLGHSPKRPGAVGRPLVIV